MNSVVREGLPEEVTMRQNRRQPCTPQAWGAATGTEGTVTPVEGTASAKAGEFNDTWSVWENTWPLPLT